MSSTVISAESGEKNDVFLWLSLGIHHLIYSLRPACFEWGRLIDCTWVADI